MEDIKVLQFVYDNFDITDVPPYGPSYILPDGKFVDIYGTTVNDKHLDTHYDVETVLNDNGLSSDEFDSLSLNYTIQEFGAIRCSTRTHEHYILLNEERPTTNQYDSILKLLILMSDDLGYPSVQIITDKDTYKIYNFTDYEPEEIVGKIKRYYSSNILYESKDDQQRLVDFVGETYANWFFDLKKQGKLKSPYNDIYYWLKKKPQELRDYMMDVHLTKTKSEQRRLDKDGAKLLYNKDGWKIYRIDTYDSAK